MNPEAATRDAMLRWITEGRRFATAVLVEVLGSAPLDPGATMLIDENGAIEGSVTGGCVEGALVEEAQRVLAGGAPVVKTYGISDELAGDVGLMCGGTVRIIVSEVTEDVAPALVAALLAEAEGRPAAIATLLDGPNTGRRLAVVDSETTGELGVTELLDRSVSREAAGLLARGVTLIRRYGSDGSTMGDDLRVHVLSYATPPRLIVFGAIDFSAAVARLARDIGYHVTICDARRPFLQSGRFEAAHELVFEWPDRYLDGVELGERDVVLVFTHDAKFDEPALIGALRTGAGYIGALGSRNTQERRRERLLEAGVAAQDIDRISAPCGLDIGAASPTETAISVLGEVIAAQTGRAGGRLGEASGPIRRSSELSVS
jgi:xanthine dehydrogenase accessory factor